MVSEGDKNKYPKPTLKPLEDLTISVIKRVNEGHNTAQKQLSQLFMFPDNMINSLNDEQNDIVCLMNLFLFEKYFYFLTVD